MHIKFLSHGEGSGKDAIDYLLAEKDHQGKVRAEVTVLRGNPWLVADVVDSLKFKHRYTSGVIAWSPEDNPSNVEIEAVLNDFEKLSFSGLEQERNSWTAIKHCDHDGGVHVHILAARVDLETGKSMNIAPPGWQKDFDPLRDYHNHKNDWARPDDPSRSRIFQPGHRLFLDKTNNPKQVLTDYLVKCIEAGIVSDREDVKEQLATVGTITRAGKNYISVKPEGFLKAIRLKGGIYDEKFDARSCNLAGKENNRGDCSGRGDSIERAGEAKGIFERAVERRREYNSRRYKKSRSLNSESIERTGITEHRFEEMDHSSSAHRDTFTNNIRLGFCSGGGALDFSSDKNSNDFGRQNKQGKRSIFQHGADFFEITRGGEKAKRSKIETAGDKGYRGDRKRGGFVSHFQKQNEEQTRALSEYRRVLGRKAGFEVTNDRNQTLVSGGLGRFTENVSDGDRKFKQSNRKLLDESRKLICTNDRFRKTTTRVLDAGQDLIRRIDQGIKKIAIRNLVTKSRKTIGRNKDRGFSR